jgi:seryl-tRNA synthetase
MSVAAMVLASMHTTRCASRFGVAALSSVRSSRTLAPSTGIRSAGWALKSTAASVASSDSAVAVAPASDAVKDGRRLSREGFGGAPDARLLADQLDLVLSHLEARRAPDATMEAAKEVSSLQATRVALIQERDAALQIRKAQSAVVGQLMRQQQGDDTNPENEAALAEAKALSSKAADDAAQAEEKLAQIDATVNPLLASIPNLLDDCVPDGTDDTDNEEVERWGSPETLKGTLGWPSDFEPKWHDDVATALGGWQAEQAVQMSGARFVALSGPVARLERAVSSFLLDLHTDQHGYTEMNVPYVVSRTALEGTGQLPKFEDDLFAISPSSHTCNGQDAFLIPTAEVPLTNLYRDSIVDHADLPLSFVALTPCFRAEAGSYGRDTRGLIRTHQFAKVELVKITTPETSHAEHELLTRHAQNCLELLELPYRKVRLCSGDIGFGAQHCYDLEVWLPSTSEYREISSCSNTGDFQARRMALRYRPILPQPDDSDNKGGKKKKPKQPKPQLCHTINGSGLAVGRTLLAVLENYQMPDGSVVVPKVLRPYMGGLEVLNPPSK